MTIYIDKSGSFHHPSASLRVTSLNLILPASTPLCHALLMVMAERSRSLCTRQKFWSS